MPYIHRPHRCGLPSAVFESHGTIWRCDECPRIWRAVVPGNPDYAGWRRVGHIGRWLRGIKGGTQ